MDLLKTNNYSIYLWRSEALAPYTCGGARPSLRTTSTQSKTLTSEATTSLLSYSFPGNVRELKSVIELAVTLSDQNEISAEHLILGRGKELLNDLFSSELSLREYDILIVKKYLSKYHNNIKLVAEKLDLGIATIYRMLKESNKE